MQVLLILEGLLKEDTLAKKEVQDCFLNSGRTMLLQAEGFESEFIDRCIAGIRRNTKKPGAG